jgi:hypothetical protein
VTSANIWTWAKPCQFATGLLVCIRPHQLSRRGPTADDVSHTCAAKTRPNSVFLRACSCPSSTDPSSPITFVEITEAFQQQQPGLLECCAKVLNDMWVFDLQGHTWKELQTVGSGPEPMMSPANITHRPIFLMDLMTTPLSWQR